MATDFVDATARFEDWLRSQIEINPDELEHKHLEMAAKDGLFRFFRGTYYRWAELWPQLCPECLSSPRVLGIGDLHVENFGTWRDHEGRLIWGINDFDDADTLPLANDLVRLAASAIAGADKGSFNLSPKKMCRAILAGYTEQLDGSGKPFVLEEDHVELRRMATAVERDPVLFWRKMNKDLQKALEHASDSPPEDVKIAIRHDLHFATDLVIGPRLWAGMGSLGKPRYVGIAKVMGACVAREAKALTPPVTAMFDPQRPVRTHIPEIITRVRRCADPFLRIDGGWIVRRLAPRCCRIELAGLDNVDDDAMMFRSMGAETANIHLGTPGAKEPIQQWLLEQGSDWLLPAAQVMLDATRDDWKTWRKHFKL